ncbi:aminodeoxychorismate synthase component I [Microbacterium luticocti]|uniref:aminodeoxychorismate synthase component I n=1 Tax=Microbacterium luticocti TaxID=451764 RepID=UPI0003F5ECFF|nr:aminodeoxychorismate synthase component I [Microbacterium luticocti]
MLRTLPTRAAPWRGPDDLFRALAARHRDVFWLDAGPHAAFGLSAIGWGRPDDPFRVRAVRCGADAGGTGDRVDPAGWVGWVGYETGAQAAGAPAATDHADVPAELWLRVQGIAVFDHARRTMRIGGEIDPADPAPALPAAPPARTATGRHTPDEYAALIGRCRDAIRAGDAYQLCLTTRFEVPGQVDAVAAYLALRAASGAHHGGFVRSGPVALLSASPERFLQVESGTVRTQPIKGTRPRGRDAAADAALAAELAADPKEQAENVMIVDLMRNDLSRVCRSGSVHVESLLQVETYPTVHQLVSTVAGRLRDDVTVGDLLAAAFPAGSMTGAPKLSAMTNLHRLEGGPRGVYSGCFGWVDVGGDLDLAMVIRSIVVHPHGAYVGAGGGITWRSVAAAEVAEVGVKARAPLAALGAAVPDGW